MTGILKTLAQEKQDKKVDVFGASLSRRGFVAGGRRAASRLRLRALQQRARGNARHARRSHQ